MTINTSNQTLAVIDLVATFGDDCLDSLPMMTLADWTLLLDYLLCFVDLTDIVRENEKSIQFKIDERKKNGQKQTGKINEEEAAIRHMAARKREIPGAYNQCFGAIKDVRARFANMTIRRHA